MDKLNFVEVTFATSSKRYTYHSAEKLAVGDKVTVLTSDGVTPVTVVRLLQQAPAFKTKPIHGRRA